MSIQGLSTRLRHKIEINFISRFAINVAKLEVQLVFECLTAKLYYLITNLQYCSQMHTRYKSTTIDHWIHERFEKVSKSNIYHSIENSNSHEKGIHFKKILSLFENYYQRPSNNKFDQ